MSDIAELENRIAAALDRIGSAVGKYDPTAGPSEAQLEDARDAGAAQAREEAQDALDRFSAEISQLKEALEAEQTANAQLRERVAALKTKKDRQAERLTEMDAEATSLREERAKDRAELDDLVAALTPLVKEQV